MSLMRIDEIFSFEKGVLQSSKCVPGEFDFITASSDWKTHNEYTHDCEALIFAAAASGSLGRTHYVNGKFVSSDLCFIITPKDQENLPVDLKFYHILFNELKDEIVRNTKAGTSKEAIGLGSFGKYELPYFDIDTQIEIKNKFVNSEDIKSSLTTELNQQVGLVKKLRQQLLQDAVQGKLVAQNPNDEPASELLKKIKAEKEKLIANKKLKKEKELSPIKPEELKIGGSQIPFEIPENWVWCRLGEMSINLDGQRIPVSQSERERKDKIYDYYGASGVIDKIDNYTHDGKFLLIGEDGANLIAKSTPIAFIAEGKFWVNNHAHVINFIDDITIYFMTYCLNAINIKPYITGGFQPKLSQGNLNSILIPLPPLSEQNRIVQKLDELMQYCNELEASIKESEAQNEKLLQQVLREALRPVPHSAGEEPIEA
jgi:type I restriction enzyme S subunit